MQDEIQREYGKIAAATVDGPYVNGAFRAGVGADFPFLSDEDRRVAEELDLIELTDQKHRPYLPMTFVLDSALRIHGVWCGFWFWGNPTSEELRQAQAPQAIILRDLMGEVVGGKVGELPQFSERTFGVLGG